MEYRWYSREIESEKAIERYCIPISTLSAKIRDEFVDKAYRKDEVKIKLKQTPVRKWIELANEVKYEVYRTGKMCRNTKHYSLFDISQLILDGGDDMIAELELIDEGRRYGCDLDVTDDDWYMRDIANAKADAFLDLIDKLEYKIGCCKNRLNKSTDRIEIMSIENELQELYLNYNYIKKFIKMNYSYPKLWKININE